MDRYGYGMMKDGTDYNIYTTLRYSIKLQKCRRTVKPENENHGQVA